MALAPLEAVPAPWSVEPNRVSVPLVVLKQYLGDFRKKVGPQLVHNFLSALSAPRACVHPQLRQSIANAFAAQASRSHAAFTRRSMSSGASWARNFASAPRNSAVFSDHQPSTSAASTTRRERAPAPLSSGRVLLHTRSCSAKQICSHCDGKGRSRSNCSQTVIDVKNDRLPDCNHVLPLNLVRPSVELWIFPKAGWWQQILWKWCTRSCRNDGRQRCSCENVSSCGWCAVSDASRRVFPKTGCCERTGSQTLKHARVGFQCRPRCAKLPISFQREFDTAWREHQVRRTVELKQCKGTLDTRGVGPWEVRSRRRPSHTARERERVESLKTLEGPGRWQTREASTRQRQRRRSRCLSFFFFFNTDGTCRHEHSVPSLLSRMRRCPRDVVSSIKTQNFRS